jgi:hypothetical protein
MATVSARKKEELAAKAERLGEKKGALTAQLDKLNAEGEDTDWGNRDVWAVKSWWAVS